MSFEVEPDALDSVASALNADARTLQSLIAKLQDGAVTSDAYGQLGNLVGVNDQYHQQLEEATREISEAAAFLDRAAGLLTSNAEAYRFTDTQHAEQFGKML